jgi:hypothetical protein
MILPWKLLPGHEHTVSSTCPTLYPGTDGQLVNGSLLRAEWQLVIHLVNDLLHRLLRERPPSRKSHERVWRTNSVYWQLSWNRQQSLEVVWSAPHCVTQKLASFTATKSSKEPYFPTIYFLKMAVFWVVAPCRLVWVYRRFRGLYCLHHQGDEAVQTSEKLVNSHQSSPRYNPEASHLIFIVTAVENSSHTNLFFNSSHLIK